MGTRWQMTPLDKALAARAYIDGMSPTEIGRIFFRGRRAIDMILTRKKVLKTRKPKQCPTQYNSR